MMSTIRPHAGSGNPLRLLIAAGAASALCFAAPAQAGGGIVTSEGYGDSQVNACTAAKSGGQGKATLDAARSGSLANVRVTGFSSCSCEKFQGPGYPASDKWKCTVDVTYTT